MSPVHYGNVAAVEGVSVKVEEGEIVAMIGPNGAGKTSPAPPVSGLVRRRPAGSQFDAADITGGGRIASSRSDSPTPRRVAGSSRA